MIFRGLKKQSGGRFITRYDLCYETEDGQEKIYEMISRNPDMRTLADVSNPRVDAVVMIMHDASGDRILLSREFRMAAGSWVYNFPAGMIDPGETPEQAAERELREETGLRLVRITDTIGESYSAIGFSNEKNVCIVGVAEGEFRASSSSFEEIVPAWYSREELRRLLRTEPFAARTQAYCYLWSAQRPEAF
ncbi:NUDIX hydrolase [Lachnoclostridium sp. Marseille-P6806]|uniref:NUDIX hydrolase n=1 Tax=Lachnoclostridium sp. Marseille-P6806 TaxID=2364793 RepID=UPI00102FE5DA|nr:NUDIX hydrolase [Lachnoclostridium sp. Marseille-P6806]